MNDFLIVIDMQNDFVSGTLGSQRATAIVPRIAEFAKQKDFRRVFTLDTHYDDYLDTSEGKHLPVKHCIKGSLGHELCTQLLPLTDGARIFEKHTFGSVEMAQWLSCENEKKPIDSITVVGVCTDICVVSNALLIKAFLPETNITVDASMCAGTSAQAHSAALKVMALCHIDVQGVFTT